MMKKCRCRQNRPCQMPDYENALAWMLMGSLVLAGVGAIVALWMLKRRRATPVPAFDAVPAFQPLSRPEPAASPEKAKAEILPKTEPVAAGEVPLEPEPIADVLPEAKPAEETVPDDLTRIEGIGPKISGVLQAAEITTFGQLADTNIDQLQQILRESNIRLAHPGTWPEQAALAAAGEWEQLKALQSTLKGGRRLG